MLSLYLKVLLPGQHHMSCLSLAEAHLTHRRVVVYVALVAGLVVHVGDILPTGGMHHPIRLLLKSFFGLEKLLHIQKQCI
jgi:hypothetical protein